MSYLILALALGPPITSFMRDLSLSRASVARKPEDGRVMAYTCLLSALLLTVLGGVEFVLAVVGVIQHPTQPPAFRQHLADAFVAYVGVALNFTTFKGWRMSAGKP